MHAFKTWMEKKLEFLKFSKSPSLCDCINSKFVLEPSLSRVIVFTGFREWACSFLVSLLVLLGSQLNLLVEYFLQIRQNFCHSCNCFVITPKQFISIKLGKFYLSLLGCRIDANFVITTR